MTYVKNKLRNSWSSKSNLLLSDTRFKSSMYRLIRLNSIKHYGQICCFSTRRLNHGGIKGGKNTYERKTLPPELCTDAVTLTCESSANGGVCDVYLVGTTHYTPKSRQEVKAVIDFLKPQVVFLELCYSRDPQKMKIATKIESEFHVAYEEAIKYGGKVILGDRPILITLRRTFAKMPLWQKKKFLYSLLFQVLPNPENLGKTLMEMSKQLPSPMEILVHERDQYMSATLLKVAREHNSVVAVVGKGHLPGIQKNWKQPIEMKQLLGIPSEKRSISFAKILSTIGVTVAVVSGLYLSVKK